jgi:pyruvate-formate lyase-activating enzyme
MKQEFCGTDIKVCPIQGRQLRDVREEDIFEDFRICNTYRGGGGYDQFPAIAKKRGLLHNFIKGDISQQFVVQLRGCHLRCPYCYVTRDGIYGKTVKYEVYELTEAFRRAHKKHDVGTFHMMGGAPMLHHKIWCSIPIILFPSFLFTSDLLLTEGNYDRQALNTMNMSNALYAINIKGVTNLDHRRNTGKNIDWHLFWNNFDKVMKVGLNFYITFTNPDTHGYQRFVDNIEDRYGKKVLKDSFVINLKQYDALEDGEAW